MTLEEMIPVAENLYQGLYRALQGGYDSRDEAGMMKSLNDYEKLMKDMNGE